MSLPRIWAVVPAAGAGRRMGAAVPKQYLALGSCTVLEHTLRALAALDLAGLVLALAADDTHGRTLAQPFKGVQVVTGGAERAWSVLAGLDALLPQARANDWVLVHDAARPCVRGADVRRLCEVALDSGVGTILALPLSDTVKRVGADRRIEQTLDRGQLWCAQTPQCFPLQALRAALAAALQQGDLVTDEAAAMERAGHPVQVLAGAPDNIKITHAADLPLAAFFLARQAEEPTCA